MDLGIAGRRAVVCASSAGLGRACATELARAGAIVILNGRRADALEATARDIRDETGADVRTVVGSVADLDVQEALVAAADGAVDILVNNNGGPPFRAFTDVDDDDIRAGVENNMVTPIALARRVLGGMVERRFGRIVNITSASVKMPIAGLDVSSGARAGLTGFLAGVARDVAHANVTINFLLPGSSTPTGCSRGSRSPPRPRAGRSTRSAGPPPPPSPPRGSESRMSSARRAPSSPPIGPGTSPARACSSTAAPIAASSEADHPAADCSHPGATRDCRSDGPPSPPHRTNDRLVWPAGFQRGEWT